MQLCANDRFGSLPKNVVNSRNPCAGALVVLGFVPGGTYGCVFLVWPSGQTLDIARFL